MLYILVVFANMRSGEREEGTLTSASSVVSKSAMDTESARRTGAVETDCAVCFGASGGGWLPLPQRGEKSESHTQWRRAPLSSGRARA